MSQNVVYQGQATVFAFHDDQVDLTGIYGEVTVLLPDGGTQTIAAPDIVKTPRDFIYAFDPTGHRLDPRYYAGDGGTPLDPVAARQAPRGAVLSSPPARPRPAPLVIPPPPMPLPEPEPTPIAESSET